MLVQKYLLARGGEYIMKRCTCAVKMYLCCQLVSGGKWSGIIELYMSGLLNCTCRCCFGNQEFKYRIMIAECFITWWSYKFLKSNAFDIENNIGRLISGLESFIFLFHYKLEIVFCFVSDPGWDICLCDWVPPLTANKFLHELSYDIKHSNHFSVKIHQIKPWHFLV